MQLEEGKTYEKIYVIGHKNPDTDSICSAIAYADFKKRTGHKGYIPARPLQYNQQKQEHHHPR